MGKLEDRKAELEERLEILRADLEIYGRGIFPSGWLVSAGGMPLLIERSRRGSVNNMEPQPIPSHASAMRRVEAEALAMQIRAFNQYPCEATYIAAETRNAIERDEAELAEIERKLNRSKKS